MIGRLNDEVIFVSGLKQTGWRREWFTEYSSSRSSHCVKTMARRYDLNSNNFKFYWVCLGFDLLILALSAVGTAQQNESKRAV